MMPAPTGKRQPGCFARPPFALDRLRELDPEHLLYTTTKPGQGGSGPLRLTQPNIHHHRFLDVLARATAHGQDTRQPCTSGVGLFR
jgi:hypothetical protein